MGITGTQIHILELLQGLHRTGRVRLRVAVPGRCDPYAAEILERLDGVEQILIDQVSDSTEPTDVAHRPWQVNSPLDMQRLRQMGNRDVVTQQDFIAFRNPGYFRSYDDWERYRQCTRLALTGAERVVFFSHHANIDRLWWDWYTSPAGAGKDPSLTGAAAVMDPWATTEPDTRERLNVLHHAVAVFFSIGQTCEDEDDWIGHRLLRDMI